MEPIFGFMLFFATAVVIWIVASKRGRAGWAFFLCTIAGGFALARLGYAATGSSVSAGFWAFVAPVIAFVVTLAAPTSEAQAVTDGHHGDFKKCPFCAESVRREAIKCKHCGSALS